MTRDDFNVLRREWNDRLRESVERTCASCGKHIVGTTRRQYCDSVCRLRAHRARLAERRDGEQALNDITESLGYLPTWTREDMQQFFGMHVTRVRNEDGVWSHMPDTDDGETYRGIEVIGNACTD